MKQDLERGHHLSTDHNLDNHVQDIKDTWFLDIQLLYEGNVIKMTHSIIHIYVLIPLGKV